MIYTSAAMAFAHHLCAFTVVGALAAEIVLFKLPLTMAQARRLQRVDAVFGAAAGALLLVGLLRVFFFEKGASYYFANTFFLAKLGLFIIAAVVSIYPTMLFLSWRGTLQSGSAPDVSVAVAARVRMCLMLELAAIVGILLCAPLMARGFGAH